MFPRPVLVGINVSLDCYCIVIGLLVLISLLIRGRENSKTERMFLHTVVAAIVMEISDIFTWVCEGNERFWFKTALPVSMYIYYVATFFILVCFVYYICFFMGADLSKKWIRIAIVGSFILFFFTLFTNPFTGAFFTISEDNEYARGNLFFITIVLELIYYGITIICIIKNWKNISFEKLWPSLSFIVFPQIMQIIQYKSYGISLINTGYTLSFIVIFINTYKRLSQNFDVKASEVRQKEAQIIRMKDQTILSLSSLVENRDTDTGEHVRRTADYVELLASQSMRDGYYRDTLTDKFIMYLERAAPMHDVGKIVVSDEVLKKTDRLTPEEFEQIKLHASEGGRIIHEILGEFEDKEYVQIASDIAMYHHEKWDGSGYPKGLKGDKIPLSARIMALSDVFDALVSPRCYKEPMSYDEAFAYIEENAGIHFDPILAAEFVKLKDKVISIDMKYKNK